ncbi:unnamed protein product [Rhizoctonia solani]|uniref:Uncharacterized protein n=1 Tax=Rhizoctonia solani TaxID=456999 RepID=A0A8H3E7Z1_9AGAM|nr:unnamed protein product [Rhizoctonia solani]CAE7200567.1 unnamed protein product [Rhizoctonia solani]
MDMSLAPGTYIIHDTDSDTDRVLQYYKNSLYSDIIGTWINNQGVAQKWHVKCYPGSSTYAIQNVGFKRYIAVDQGGKCVCGVEEEAAAILDLERSFQDFYLIKLTSKGTECYLEHSSANDDGYSLVKFAEKTSLQGCYWRFERVGDDTGDTLKPKAEDSTPAPEVRQSNNTLPSNPGSLYSDDAHFYTDMLFNMPRTPFARTQRIAVLDWARKLGAANVPTIESFEECERRLEAAGK